MHIDGNTSKSINNRKDTNMETKATGRPTYKYKVTPMIRTNKGSLNQVQLDDTCQAARYLQAFLPQHKRESPISSYHSSNTTYMDETRTQTDSLGDRTLKCSFLEHGSSLLSISRLTLGSLLDFLGSILLEPSKWNLNIQNDPRGKKIGCEWQYARTKEIPRCLKSTGSSYHAEAA